MAQGKTRKGARPGARPRGPYEEKRSTLTTRITEGTRKKLEDSAHDAGRSLSQEIELRLDRSYAQEEELYARFGGKGQYRWLLLLAATLQMIEEVTGKKWDQDHQTNDEARDAIKVFVERFSPKHPRRGLLVDLPSLGYGTRLAEAVLDRFVRPAHEEIEKDSGKVQKQ